MTREGETDVKHWSDEEILFSLVLFQFIQVDAKWNSLGDQRQESNCLSSNTNRPTNNFSSVTVSSVSVVLFVA